MLNSFPSFNKSVNNELNAINATYTNARYAPVGDAKVGIPFLGYKQFGGNLTQWSPTSSDNATWKIQMKLPTDNNAFRGALSNNAVGVQNTGLVQYVAATQTLAKPTVGTLSCTSDSDCSSLPNTICNTNFSPWGDSHGSQAGSTCVHVEYPELKDGKYSRKDVNQGGIGRACKSSNDCGEGYDCNNNVTTFGQAVQQTGYCSMPYTCPDGSKRYLGTPWNSGIPKPPVIDQNKGGKGFPTKEACNSVMLAQQTCQQGANGAWYATYPGFCPIAPSMREGVKGQGALRQFGAAVGDEGFIMPSFGNSAMSTMGKNSTVNALASWNIQKPQAMGALSSIPGAKNQLSTPLMYSLSINPPINGGGKR